MTSQRAFIERTKAFILNNSLIKENDKILIGVSGGADSVCLLRVLKQLQSEYKLTLMAVHVNHGIRGDEAVRDERFVEALCSKLSVEFRAFHRNIPQISRDEKLSEEEAGRIVRYGIFRQLLLEEQFDRIAVAHNAGDNVETILHNIFRGTGIAGLRGIESQNGDIIRPILFAERSEIEEYLTDIKQDYITDSTNNDCEYTRNKLRNKLIPYIEEEINSRASEHIIQMSRQLADIDNYLNCESDRAYNEICTEKNNDCREVVINAERISKLQNPIRQKIVRRAILFVAGKLKDVTSVHVDSILALCDMQTSKSVNLPYKMVARKEYDYIVISNYKSAQNDLNNKIDFQMSDTLDLEQDYVIDKCTLKNENIHINLDNEKFVDICVKENEKNTPITENNYTKYLDYDKIKGNLSIRKRQQGDFLVVNNHGGSKKLKNYFIDIKVPLAERDNVWLLADDSHIMWVLGYRISEAYKITKDTKNILQIRLSGEV